MLSTQTVLNGQIVAYTLYVLVVMSIIAWFTYRVTRGEEAKQVRPAFFYVYLALLIIAGVSIHLLTRFTIPWKELDLEGDRVTADQTFNINVADHKFALPAQKMVIKKGEIVRFSVTSSDLTYGFGLFRPNNTMLFQMQVLPGHQNNIVWEFGEPGAYTIRSTEYSGPEGVDMVERDAVVVTE
ncbi:MAG: cytochrome C oxidase subunit II [Coriobacteriales bacterium]|nr:cytochrome C oxidase subunit II [Coriobacteriales bacterium]